MAVRKLTPKELEKVFPVKTAIRENAMILIKAFGDAAEALGDAEHTGITSTEEHELRAARIKLTKFINTLIEEIV